MRARIIALLLGLIALALIAGGIQLALLGGSLYYLLAGIACLAVGIGLWRGAAWAGVLFGLFLVATLAWSIAEAGLAPWPLVARLAGPLVIGLLVAWVAFGKTGRRTALISSLICLAVLTAAFFRPHPEAVQGSTPTGPVPAPVAQAEWLHWGNDQGGTRFSPAADITPANVSKLKVAWTYNIGSTQKGGAHTFEAVPIQADGLVTFCAPNNDVIALDAASGKQVWRWRSRADLRGVVGTSCRGVSRHVTAGATGTCATRIITATLDARMVALDALTGKPCDGFGQGGQIDLTRGYGDVLKGYYYITSAPAIIGDKAVIGGWGKDNQSVGQPSGVIRAFDVRTGELAWAWDMGRPDKPGLPGPGEEYTRGTPNSWAPISVDEQLGLVYLPMGNATPDYIGLHRRPVDNKYSSAVVALDAATGRDRWVFQTVHHDLWDYDVPAQPVLFDMPGPNGAIPALVQYTKQGQLFVLDRRTGQPLMPVTERKVPTVGAPGERISPTQPFSTRMPDVAGPDLTEAQMWGMTPIDQMMCRILFRQSEYRGKFTPPVPGRHILINPGIAGNWGSVTIDPIRHMLVMPSTRFAFRNELVTREEADRRGARPSGAGDSHLDQLYAMAGTPYAMDVSPFLSPLTLPCQQPPYGMVHGIDLATGKLVWEHPLGTTRNSGPFGMRLGLDLPMGVPVVGGASVTATGLMFVAASQDGYLRALETRSGKELWRAALPYGGQSIPITYKLRDGKQYVVTAAGGHVSLGLPPGDALVAYALPD